jgi:TolA-binding protein
MKRAHLAWTLVMHLPGLVYACAPAEPPPGAPATVTIAASPPRVAAPGEPPPPVAAVAVAAPSPLDTVRDERRFRHRSRALMVTELQALESLATATPASSPDRPRLLRRLADGYAELAATAQAERADKLRVQSLHASAKYYRSVAVDYPKHCDVGDAFNPAISKGCADESTYYWALDSERAGEIDMARRGYLDLIQRFPNSRFVPGAYYAFGELFLVEAEQDPSKYPLAEQAYLEVVKFPLPDNHVHASALVRLGRVYVAKGDDARALSTLVAAMAAAKSGDESGVGAVARRDAVAVYARVGNPAQARAFFSRIASNDKELDDMLTELARRQQAP